MKDVVAADCVGTLDTLSMEFRGVLQHISPTEQIPMTYQAVSRYMAKVPMVVDWMKRSAFHHGASTTFALALSHYPEDFELHLVVEGYCGDSGPFSIERAQDLFAEAAPYAEGVLVVVNLLHHLASQVAPGKSVPEPRDFPVEQPFWAAVAGGLTTHLW
jgi:hypothetical protein